MDKEHQSATTRENIQKAHDKWRLREDHKRVVAEVNAKARSQRSDKQQLTLLSQRPGASTKERTRLLARIKEAKK